MIYEIQESNSKTNCPTLDGLSIVEIMKRNKALPETLVMFADMFAKKCEYMHKN